MPLDKDRLGTDIADKVSIASGMTLGPEAEEIYKAIAEAIIDELSANLRITFDGTAIGLQAYVPTGAPAPVPTLGPTGPVNLDGAVS